MVQFANSRNVVSCNFCGNMSILDATDEEFAAWDSGVLIQDAMPRLSVNDREMLISGCCPKCWDKMWPSEDEEVDIQSHGYGHTIHVAGHTSGWVAGALET